MARAFYLLDQVSNHIVFMPYVESRAISFFNVVAKISNVCKAQILETWTEVSDWYFIPMSFQQMELSYQATILTVFK